MNTAVKLSAYGAVVALVAGGGWATGTAVGPFPGEAGPAAGHGDTHGGTVAEAPEPPGGLASSSGGYTFTPAMTTLPPGPNQPFAFTITGPDGKPVTAYEVEHEKRLHLIAVRRDTSGFQHVHPELGTDGVWRTGLDLPQAGAYRVFADFKPTGGEALTLGVDTAVAGDFQPRAFEPAREADVDGYRVRLTGDLVPGRSSKVVLTVDRDGVPVTDLQPYLGAYGHLVALRGGDLAYLHVHPDGEPGDGRTPAGPGIVFHTEVPSAGTYRLFLDFQHGGVVRTAEFTVATQGEEQA